MALKPFWNKKYHLGMKPEDVKTILNNAGNNVVADLTNELITVSLADITTLVGGSTVTYSDIPEAKFANWLDILNNPNKVPRSIVAKVATDVNTYVLVLIPFTGTNDIGGSIYSSIVDILNSLYKLYVVLDVYNPGSKTYRFKAFMKAL